MNLWLGMKGKSGKSGKRLAESVRETVRATGKCGSLQNAGQAVHAQSLDSARANPTAEAEWIAQDNPVAAA
jgi:hypothetical protein